MGMIIELTSHQWWKSERNHPLTSYLSVVEDAKLFESHKKKINLKWSKAEQLLGIDDQLWPISDILDGTYRFSPS